MNGDAIMVKLGENHGQPIPQRAGYRDFWAWDLAQKFTVSPDEGRELEDTRKNAVLTQNESMCADL